MILEDDFLETCRPQVTFIRPTAKKRYVVYPDHSELDVLKQGIIEKNKGGYEFLLIIVLLHISDIFATSIKVSLFGVLPLVLFFVSDKPLRINFFKGKTRGLFYNLINTRN